MRAHTTILQRTQLPLTLAGLPPAVAPATLAFGLTILLAGLFAGWPVIGFTTAIVAVITTCVYVAIRNNADPHFMTAGSEERRFWRGRKARVFLAGSPTPDLTRSGRGHHSGGGRA